VNALTHLHYREQRLSNARAEIRAVYRAGGMSDRELFDMVCMLASLCSPEQAEHKARLLTIASDLDEPEPDADAFRRYPGPQTLDSRLERA
jgi:hypothetical protein